MTLYNKVPHDLWCLNVMFSIWGTIIDQTTPHMTESTVCYSAPRPFSSCASYLPHKFLLYTLFFPRLPTPEWMRPLKGCVC